MTRPRVPYAGRPSRRTRDTSVVGRRPVGGRARPCHPRRPFGVRPCSVQIVTDLAGPASRLTRPWTGLQAAMIVAAAAADTLRAVRAMPGWSIGVGPVARAFTGSAAERIGGGERIGGAERIGGGERIGGAERTGGMVLIAPQVPQLNPGLLADAAELLSEFDAVLGPTSGDGWWAFGLREPAHGAVLRTMPGALDSAGSLTVAALRLGLRVAMLPTLHDLGTGTDVPAVAAQCPADSEFTLTVAHLGFAGEVTA